MKKSLALTALCAALATSFVHAAAFAQPPTGGKVSGVVADKARKQLDAIADQYYDAKARNEPISATDSGDPRFNDQVGLAIAPKVRAHQFALYRGYLKRLQAIDRMELDLGTQTNYDILDYELKSALSFEHIPEHLLPVNQMDSLPMTLANYAGGEAGQPLTNVKEYKAYLNRLNQLPAWTVQAIVNMREGMKKGIVLQKAAAVSMLPQFQKLVSDTPEESIFYTGIKEMPASIGAKDKAELSKAYRTTIGRKLGSVAIVGLRRKQRFGWLADQAARL